MKYLRMQTSEFIIIKYDKKLSAFQKWFYFLVAKEIKCFLLNFLYIPYSPYGDVWNWSDISPYSSHLIYQIIMRRKLLKNTTFNHLKICKKWLIFFF